MLLPRTCQFTPGMHRLAAQVLDTYPRLEVLVNNADGFWAHRHITADGLEHTFALDHLGAFLLIRRPSVFRRRSLPVRGSGPSPVVASLLCVDMALFRELVRGNILLTRVCL